ncbi:MAG TPA: PhzF family phenazine biosynthesis protein [Ktedonobacteraceae bacterium]|jgi:PhzF family phenazine biosynthesis protein|nr:PhzF family phenazine biosynthesis protein [Ktedonobacteraceae bacterium]
MSVQIVQVDAFTREPFAGNPAAVCLLPDARDEQWMQHVAQEMNLSETAFLLREQNGFRLRWFTPTVEVDLCGHATLASAHALWEMGVLQPTEQARFFTRSGELLATRQDAWIEMDFPVKPETTITAPASLLEALGCRATYVGKNEFDYVVEVESEEVVRNLQPDFGLLTRVPARGVIVTSRAEKREYDFVSRFFGPRTGVNEDPVTGSAHCCLAPYWGRKLGRNELIGYQASARGGAVRVRTEGERVILGGQAITVLRGELTC